jgi:hypothetical protein
VQSQGRCLIAEGQGVALIPASLQNVKRQGVVFRALKEEPRKLSMGIAVLQPFLELLRTSTPSSIAR